MTDMNQLPGWGFPDVGDDGLPCAFGSLLACWAQQQQANRTVQGIDGVMSWSENILHRLWMPGRWADRIDPDCLHRNLRFAPTIALDAMTTLDDGTRLPDRKNERWETACERFATLAQPDFNPNGLTTLKTTPEQSSELCEIGGLLRAWWLARLHETNRMWDTRLDWADADTHARTLHLKGERAEWHRQAVNRFRQLASAPSANTPRDEEIG